MTRGKITILLFIFAILSLLSMLSVYYTHLLPTEEIETTTLDTYKHVGTYDYTAKLKSNIIYNQSELKPGQGTLYTSITEYINTTFSYTFESSQEANIIIEYSIDVILESPQWSKTFHSVPQTKLNPIGNVAKFSNNYLVNITSVQELKNTLEEETGARVTDYNVTIRPEIHTIANNNITTIDEYFTPTMTMAFGRGTPEGNYISIIGLEHTRPNTITHTKKIPIPGVMNQRYASYGFCAITLSALVVTIWAYTKTLKPSLKPKKSMEEIVAPHEEIITNVAGEPSYKGQIAIITMKSLEDLVKVADWLGKPVLSCEKAPSGPSKESTRIFYVLDGLTKYQYETKAPRVRTDRKVIETYYILPSFVGLIRARIDLILAAFGSIALAFVGQLTWHDITVWGKDIALIFFGSRTGEAISLGIGMRVIHYFLIGSALLLSGIFTFFRKRRARGITAKAELKEKPNPKPPVKKKTRTANPKPAQKAEEATTP